MATFGGVIADAAAGFGVAQPGAVPFTFTRTSAGIYQVNFDTRLRAVSGVATTDTVTRAAAMYGFGAGSFTITRFTTNAGAPENGGSSFTCTAIDKRT